MSFRVGWGPEKMFGVPQMKELRKIRMQHKNFKKLKSKFRSRKLNELVKINPKTSDIESVEILKSRYYPDKSLDEWVEHFRPLSEFDENKWEGFVRTIRDQQISGLHSDSSPLVIISTALPPRFQSFSLLKALEDFFWVSYSLSACFGSLINWSRISMRDLVSKYFRVRTISCCLGWLIDWGSSKILGT